MNFTVQNLEHLPKIVQLIEKKISHKIIIFQGEMGAGKTTFIKELIKCFGTKDEAKSPTFSIVNEYETDKGKVFHFDFYRLNSEDEALDFGLEEYICSNEYCFMEWSNKISNFIPKNHHTVSIKNIDSIRYIDFN